MAQLTVRANIQTATFPLLSRLAGRTVVAQQYDQTYLPSVNVDGQDPIDKGNPQILYCHNVMPSVYGFQSVGYRRLYPPIFGTGINLRERYLVYSKNTPVGGTLAVTSRSEIGVDRGNSALDNLYVIKEGSTSWVLIPNTGITDGNNQFTIATVNGETIIFVAYKGAYRYNALTSLLEPITLVGLDPTNIKGIASSFGYLIAYGDSSVVWSSVLDPFDFVPSDVTGAGGGSIQQATGKIVHIVSTALGYVVYTQGNAVSSLYSGNQDFPWIFSEIPSSGGISTKNLVTSEDESGRQFAYTTNGLQQVAHTGAKTAFPAITDFMSGKTFEDFDEINNVLITTNLVTGLGTTNRNLKKRISYISDRYLIISYGLPSAGLPDVNDFTHAIVIDVARSRLGKIKFTHTACYELKNLFGTEVVESPRESVALLARDGSINVVDFRLSSTNSAGVMIIGKYQFVRSRQLQLDKVDVESVNDDASFTLFDLPTLDGKTFLPTIPGYLENSAGLSSSYLFDNVAYNHSILFKGSFDITSMVLTFNIHGKV